MQDLSGALCGNGQYQASALCVNRGCVLLWRSALGGQLYLQLSRGAATQADPITAGQWRASHQLQQSIVGFDLNTKDLAAGITLGNAAHNGGQFAAGGWQGTGCCTVASGGTGRVWNTGRG